jgi:hypothetical protein
VPVDIYLDGNRPGGRDLQGASLLSARLPWLPPWRILKRTFRRGNKKGIQMIFRAVSPVSRQ